MIIMRSLLFTILISVIVNTLSAQDVAQWRGPNRDGIYSETGLNGRNPDQSFYGSLKDLAKVILLQL